MYNYNHLYYFYMTAKSGGVSRASDHLRISQPSLSSQLKTLERSLDLKLFHKVGRNNRLTQAGAVLYGYCRRMFELSEEMTDQISKGVPSATRRINIGVSDEVDRPFVVEVVSLFLKKHGPSQRPKVTVISGDASDLSERLRFRELDAVVTEIAMTAPELANLESSAVPVGLACSNKWKPNFKGNAAIKEIKDVLGGEDTQWVMPSPRFKLRSETDRFFEKNALKGRVVFESDVVASLVRSVIDEIGFAFLPLLYVAREVRENSIRILVPAGGYWKYRVWLGCHKQDQADPLVRTLSLSFKQVCRQADL